jgi:hypothetical protein
MAEGAGVESLLAGEPPGVDNIVGRFFFRVCGVVGYVLRSGTVASFTVDAVYYLPLVEQITSVGRTWFGGER